MTTCPNSERACECQPQDGVMCPHGPTPPYPVAIVRADLYGGATVLWDVKPNELPPGTRLYAHLPDGVPACRKCGQTDQGQTGEYACSECGLPTVWDAPAAGVPAVQAPNFTDEQLSAAVDAALPGLDENTVKALTFTRWSDGIDIQYPTVDALKFAEAVYQRLNARGVDLPDGGQR